MPEPGSLRGSNSPTLSVFDGIDIPVDYASVQKYAILARSGGGKTYTLAKLLEQFCDADLFFVCLDPVGKHWSLRAGVDGKPRGGKSNVVVLGGQHGDVPLSAEDGALIADVVVQHPGRYVLDVSDFESDAEQDRFAHAFAKRLFRAKKQNQFPLLIALEEAEAFIPQTVQPGQQQMLGAFARLQKVGRNYGLGMCLVSQRPQDIAKKVLNQTEVLIVKQLVAKLEREAIVGWVKYNGVEVDLNETMRDVAGFEPQDALVYSPSWLRVFQRTTVLKRETFDSSASARTGDAAVTPELKPLDVDALASQLEEAREKATAQDPKALRKRVAELQARLDEGIGPDTSRETEKAQARADAAEAQIRQLQEELVAERNALADVQTQLDAAREATDLVATLRQAFTALLGDVTIAQAASTGGEGYPGDRHILDLIRAHAPAGGGAPTLKPVEALRADYLERTAQRLVTIVRDLAADEREALLFLISRQIYVAVNATAKALSGNDGGGTRQRWSLALNSLAGSGLAAKGGTSKAQFKENVEAWVRSELGPHGPTDSEIEAVRDRALSVLQGGS